MPDFNALLRDAELSDAEFGALIARLAGERIDRVTVWRWRTGKIKPHPAAVALLRVLAEIKAMQRAASVPSPGPKA